MIDFKKLINATPIGIIEELKIGEVYLRKKQETGRLLSYPKVNEIPIKIKSSTLGLILSFGFPAEYYLNSLLESIAIRDEENFSFICIDANGINFGFAAYVSVKEIISVLEEVFPDENFTKLISERRKYFKEKQK